MLTKKEIGTCIGLVAIIFAALLLIGVGPAVGQPTGYIGGLNRAMPAEGGRIEFVCRTTGNSRPDRDNGCDSYRWIGAGTFSDRRARNPLWTPPAGRTGSVRIQVNVGGPGGGRRFRSAAWVVGSSSGAAPDVPTPTPALPLAGSLILAALLAWRGGRR